MAYTSTQGSEKSFIRRILTSRVLLIAVFLVIIIGLAELGILGLSREVQADQAQFLSDTVRRSAVQCYAIEGHYPQSLSYLEENYGLIIDRDRYAVYYESMGDNILPQIRVLIVKA